MSERKNQKKKVNLKEVWSKSKVEVAKALHLGKKMFSAGKINIEIRDTLSQLGLAVYQKEKSNNHAQVDQEIKNLINKVDYLSKLMDTHEGEIQKIKNKPQLT